MVTPPIGPPLPPSGFPLEGGVPLRERVHHDLMAIQHTAAELQTSMGARGTPARHSMLLEKFKAPIEDLAQLTRQRPQVLSQNEIDVINTLQMQYQLVQMESDAITPSAVAAMQGSASTIEQMFAAEVAKTPEPNSAALQAQNYLSALTDALQMHLGHHAEMETIVGNMQNPLDELSHMAERGTINPDQARAVAELKKLYNEVIQPSEAPTPQATAQFQSSLQALNALLMSH